MFDTDQELNFGMDPGILIFLISCEIGDFFNVFIHFPVNNAWS